MSEYGQYGKWLGTDHLGVLTYFVRKYYNDSNMFAFSMLEHYCRSLLGEKYLPSDFTPLAESGIRSAIGKVAALKIKQFNSTLSIPFSNEPPWYRAENKTSSFL